MNIAEVVTRSDLVTIEEKLIKLSQMYGELMQMMSCRVYTNETLANQLQVSKRTLQNWRDGGVIAFTQIGNKVFYTEDAVQQMLSLYKRRSFAIRAK